MLGIYFLLTLSLCIIFRLIMPSLKPGHKCLTCFANPSSSTMQRTENHSQSLRLRSPLPNIDLLAATVVLHLEREWLFQSKFSQITYMLISTSIVLCLPWGVSILPIEIYMMVTRPCSQAPSPLHRRNLMANLVPSSSVPIKCDLVIWHLMDTIQQLHQSLE